MTEVCGKAEVQSTRVSALMHEMQQAHSACWRGARFRTMGILLRAPGAPEYLLFTDPSQKEHR